MFKRRDCRRGIIQNRIGIAKPHPSIKIVRLIFQPRGQPFDPHGWCGANLFRVDGDIAPDFDSVLDRLRDLQIRHTKVMNAAAGVDAP